jgi:glutamine cyclotransferase
MGEIVRCRGKRHAILIDESTLEVKCDSRICGAGPGVIVLHRFDISTGREKETLKFRDPATLERRQNNGIDDDSASVRNA